MKPKYLLFKYNYEIILMEEYFIQLNIKLNIKSLEVLMQEVNEQKGITMNEMILRYSEKKKLLIII